MALNGAIHESGLDLRFLTAQSITTAVSATTVPSTVAECLKQRISGMKYVAFQVNFTYGSGGTSAKFWLQTTLDGGTSWIDIANVACTTANKNKVQVVTSNLYFANSTDHPIPDPALPVTPTDGTLGDDLYVQGILGHALRLKYVTVGTYAATTVTVSAVAKG